MNGVLDPGDDGATAAAVGVLAVAAGAARTMDTEAVLAELAGVP